MALVDRAELLPSFRLLTVRSAELRSSAAADFRRCSATASALRSLRPGPSPAVAGRFADFRRSARPVRRRFEQRVRSSSASPAPRSWLRREISPVEPCRGPTTSVPSACKQLAGQGDKTDPRPNGFGQARSRRQASRRSRSDRAAAGPGRHNRGSVLHETVGPAEHAGPSFQVGRFLRPCPSASRRARRIPRGRRNEPTPLQVIQQLATVRRPPRAGPSLPGPLRPEGPFRHSPPAGRPPARERAGRRSSPALRERRALPSRPRRAPRGAAAALPGPTARSRRAVFRCRRRANSSAAARIRRCSWPKSFFGGGRAVPPRRRPPPRAGRVAAEATSISPWQLFELPVQLGDPLLASPRAPRPWRQHWLSSAADPASQGGRRSHLLHEQAAALLRSRREAGPARSITSVRSRSPSASCRPSAGAAARPPRPRPVACSCCCRSPARALIATSCRRCRASSSSRSRLRLPFVLDRRFAGGDPFAVGGDPGLRLADRPPATIRSIAFPISSSRVSTASRLRQRPRRDASAQGFSNLLSQPASRSVSRRQSTRPTWVRSSCSRSVCSLVAPGLAGLRPDAAQPALDFVDDVGQPQQVLLDPFQPPQRLELSWP